MATIPEKPDSKPLQSWWVLGLIVGLPLILYITSLWVLSMSRDTSLDSLTCFQPDAFPHAPLAEQAAVVAAAIGACGVLFAAPLLLGILIFRAHPSRRRTAHVWSVALSSTALLVICLLLRWTTGVTRMPFLTAWWVWAAALAVWAGRNASVLEELRGLWRRHGRSLLCGLATVAIGILLFGRDQFLPCFEGDGIESFELAHSLRDHFLPTWDNEPIGRFGAVVVNPALINSYWTLGMQLLLGDGEFATRIPYWIYWLGVFLVACRIRQQFGPQSWGSLLVFALGILLIAQWYTFYVGYDPYMTDLANPGVPDALFTLFLMLAFDALLERDLAGWVIATLLGSLVLYAGPVMLGLTTLAALVWQPVERSRLLRAVAAASGLLLGIAALYLLWGWWTEMLEGWWYTFQSEYWLDYIAPIPRARLTLLYVGYFLLGCGGVAVLGLVRALWRTAWERTLATVVAAYLLIVLGSAAKNLHYLGPLFPCVLVLWVIPNGNRGREWRSWLAAVGLCASLIACWPKARPIFTLTRDLGAHTTFQTDSYQEACRWADVAVLYDLGITSWDVPPHTWVRYSTRESQPGERRAILVTTAHLPPPGYVIRAKEARTGVKICLDFYNPDLLQWAASRQPLTDSDRFPAVLSDIARRPRPQSRLPLIPGPGSRSSEDRLDLESRPHEQ